MVSIAFSCLGFVEVASAEPRFRETIDFVDIGAFKPSEDLAERASVAGFSFTMSMDELDSHYRSEGYEIVSRNSSETELDYGRNVENRQVSVEFNEFVNNITLFRRSEAFYQDNSIIYFLPGQSDQIYAIRRTANSGSAKSASFGVEALWKAVEERVGASLKVESDHNGVQSASAIFSATGEFDTTGKCSDQFSNGMGVRDRSQLGLVGYGISDRHLDLMRGFVSEDCAIFYSIVVVPNSSGQVFEMRFRSVNGLALLQSMEENNRLGVSILDELEKEARDWLAKSKSTAPDL